MKMEKDHANKLKSQEIDQLQHFNNQVQLKNEILDQKLK